jgi:hypothetical protein
VGLASCSKSSEGNCELHSMRPHIALKGYTHCHTFGTTLHWNHASQAWAPAEQWRLRYSVGCCRSGLLTSHHKRWHPQHYPGRLAPIPPLCSGQWPNSVHSACASTSLGWCTSCLQSHSRAESAHSRGQCNTPCRCLLAIANCPPLPSQPHHSWVCTHIPLICIGLVLLIEFALQS